MAEGVAMGLYHYEITDIKKTERIDRLIANLFAKMPEIESEIGRASCRERVFRAV